MHVPQIVFRYSTVYDELFQKEYERKKDIKDPYPTSEAIDVFIRVLKNGSIITKQSLKS